MEQNESLQFNNIRLEKRLTQLMFDLEKKESPSIFSLFKSPDKDTEKVVLREELTQKIRENERVNILVEDLQTKYTDLANEYRSEKEKMDNLQIQDREAFLREYTDRESTLNAQISKLEHECKKLQEEMEKKNDNDKILSLHHIESEKKLKSFLSMHFDNLDSQYNMFNVPHVDVRVKNRIAELEVLKSNRIVNCVNITNNLLQIFKIQFSPIKTEQLQFLESQSELSEEIFVKFMQSARTICILLHLCFEKNQLQESDFIFDTYHFQWSPLVETFANLWESLDDLTSQVERKLFSKTISPKKKCRKRMDFTEHEEFFSSKDTSASSLFEQNSKKFFDDLSHLTLIDNQKKVLHDLNQAIADVFQVDNEINLEREQLDILTSHGSSYSLKNAKSVFIKDIQQVHVDLQQQTKSALGRIDEFRFDEPIVEPDVFPAKIKELENNIKRIENEKIDLTVAFEKIQQMVSLYEKKTVDLFVTLQMELQKAKIIVEHEEDGVVTEQDHVIQNLDKIRQFVIQAIQIMQIREKPSSVKLDVSSGDLYDREVKLKEIYEARIDYLLGLIESCDLKGVEFRCEWQKAVLELEESFLREKNLNFQLAQLREHYHNSIEETNTIKKNYENQMAILSLELTSKKKENNRK